MTVPLPNDTVAPQMKDLAENTKIGLTANLKNYTFV